MLERAARIELASSAWKAAALERRKNAVILPEDLADWCAKIQVLPNPLRRIMHELGVFSGLRPGTLVSLRRGWVKLDERAISIPDMKSGRPFDLPLSTHMLGIVQRALDLSDGVYIHERALFDRLLDAQEKMSAEILRLCKATHV